MAKSKKIILVIFLLGVSYFIISYHSEHKKYEIANEIFNDTGIHPGRIWHTQLTLEFDNKIFKEFSLFDKISAYTQVAMQNIKQYFHINNDIKPNTIIYKDRSGKPAAAEILVHADGNKTEIRGNKRIIIMEDESYSISLPILSSDNKTAVMQINNYCGMLCGEGVVYIFKKADGKWKVAKRIEKWIS